jgi:hypothetical protein
MTRRAARGSWWLATLLGACQPSSGGVGSSGANTLGTPDDTGESSTTEGAAGTHETGITTDAPSDSTGTTTGAVGGTTDEPPPVTTGDGAPLLSLSDGPTYDFGDVVTNQAVAHVFTLTNRGDGDATGLDAAVAAPFDVPGGFPGNAGDCGPTLPAGGQCGLELRFAPTELGRHAATLTVSHDQGPALARELGGGAIGQSANLLVNGGGETIGTPPPGWTVTLGAWEANVYAAEAAPYAGSAYLLSGGGPNNDDFALRQDIDLGAWSTTVDAGQLRIALSGWARAYAAGNDEHRIRLHFRDAGGSTLSLWTSNYASQPAWTQYTDERLAPAGTRTLQVELNCRKQSGSICHAYFDALDVRASYP